jgi:hypothetical protein
MSWSRRWHKAASAVVLIAAGAHLAAHWSAFVRESDSTDPLRQAAVQAMQAYIVYPPLGTSLWTVLGGFSLAYASTLILFGTSQWILAREADPRTLRRHALRNTVLLLLASLALWQLHPMPQTLIVFLAAALLFALAALPRNFDV